MLHYLVDMYPDFYSSEKDFFCHFSVAPLFFLKKKQRNSVGVLGKKEEGKTAGGIETGKREVGL